MAGLMNAQLKHEEYLIRLGKRNKYLKAKSENNYNQESQKEGFCVYINGENKPKPKSYNTSGSKSARNKTSPVKQGLTENNAIRSKTAPENDRRRFWGQGTVTIKTDRGEKIHLSQKQRSYDYSDDFDDLNLTRSRSENCDSESSSGESYSNSPSPIYCEEISDSSEDSFKMTEQFTNFYDDEITGKKNKKIATIIRLILFSSWDGGDELGLTEIQLYDVAGKKVTIDEQSISVTGAINMSEDLSCLVNHKFKTTKDKNMIIFTKERKTMPIDIQFSVQCDKNSLSKLLVWNYNKNANELGKGSKLCKIYMNENCVFKGDLEKGCGNQIFDYAHVVNISEYLNPSKNSVDKKSGQISSGLLQMPITKWNGKADSTKSKQDNEIQRNRNNILEQSWNSLSLFNHTQFGTLLSASKSRNPSFIAKPDSKTENELKNEISIPQLPYGKNISINITSTWGDLHYVGLNGIEFFSDTGQLIKVKHITANPPDINVLPDVQNDPRVVTNLIDGVNNTNDDLHMWLTPFTPDSPHTINITFEISTKVALARIWNYNKSRIHACRGVRHITIQLDNKLVFNGEIARASGSINQTLETFGDTILFTLDEEILENVSKNDDLYSDFDVH